MVNTSLHVYDKRSLPGNLERRMSYLSSCVRCCVKRGLDVGDQPVGADHGLLGCVERTTYPDQAPIRQPGRSGASEQFIRWFELQSGRSLVCQSDALDLR